MPSAALRLPTSSPRICDDKVLLIASPAASSLAELIRLPVDSRSAACDCALLAASIARCARSAALLVPITLMLIFRPCPGVPRTADPAGISPDGVGRIRRPGTESADAAPVPPIMAGRNDRAYPGFSRKSA